MPKQTLFQIVAENHQLISDIMENGGEVTPEIEKRFEELGSELVQKVDNYVELMARLDSEADHFKKREQEMKNAKITMQDIQKRLRDAVLSALDSLNQKEVQGDTYRIMIAKTKPKIEYVESNIPDAYFNEVVEAIRDAGKHARGATLFVARVNKSGEDRLSKPCVNCQKYIEESKIKNVIYTY